MIDIKDLKRIAALHGGECLSEDIGRSINAIATFLCANNHFWAASAQRILAGEWCAKCAKKLETVEISSA